MAQIARQKGKGINNHNQKGLLKYGTSIEPPFPFSNSRLKEKRWNQECLELRPYKSRAQLSRKKIESIPLLKNLRLENDKVSIFRSAKNQYNIFVKNHNRQTSLNDQILVVNGETKTGHQRSISQNSCHKVERGLTLDAWKCKSLSLFGRKGSIDSNYFTFVRSQTTSLNINGRRKPVSPMRSGRNSAPRLQYQEIKF